MKIIPVVAGILETNCYLLINQEKRTAILIDAPPDSKKKILELLETENALLEAVLLTHTHWDHSADAAEIKKATSSKVYVHKDDYYRLQDPMNHTLMPLDFEIEPCFADYLIEHNEVLSFETCEVEVIETPGHTEGSVVFVVHSIGAAFVGDTIFYMSVGRTDLPGGDSKKLHQSLSLIMDKLPNEFTLYPGHFQPTKVGLEKKFNPFIISI
ncbi:MAG: MBL fold metallo-hydrolase [Ignavibacteria bacterium]|nr:MBL fold metallo-hydrolase [Ignavibacteria bacterium]